MTSGDLDLKISNRLGNNGAPIGNG